MDKWQPKYPELMNRVILKMYLEELLKHPKLSVPKEKMYEKYPDLMGVETQTLQYAIDKCLTILNEN